MNQLLGDLPGVDTDIDGILVWGTNQIKHDQRLEAVLKRCEEINLTLGNLNSEHMKYRTLVISSIPMVFNQILKN